MFQKGPIDPSFQARLERIKSGRAEMKNGASMVGGTLTDGPPVQKRRSLDKAQVRDVLLTPVGVLLGLTSVLVARVAVLHLVAPGGSCEAFLRLEPGGEA